MPSVLCKCGNKLNFGEIHNSIEWLMISDDGFEKFQGSVDAEAIYREMNSALKCSCCGRLLVFWNGFDVSTISYMPE